MAIRNPKLINLKLEYEMAVENVELFLFIKQTAVDILRAHPNTDPNFVINGLCNENEMSREDFDFIATIEHQYLNDVIKSAKGPKK